MNKLQNYSWGV